MDLYAVAERTPCMDDYETFMICSTPEKSLKVLQLYQKNYPRNQYVIVHHVLDDERLIKMEEDNNVSKE